MTILRAFPYVALILGSVASAPASDIDWWAITGGGGISQHGATAIGGAFGVIAPAPSPAIGGNNNLNGGFWSLLVDQPQLALPVLKIISLGAEKVLLSWPVSVHGFVLEYTADPGSGVWVIESMEAVDTLTEHTVTVAPEGAFRCYRLRGQ